MATITLELMTVTPLIMRGESQRVELRPASFRGIFRYWTRALLGREVGDDLQRLQNEEAEIWGSTGQSSAIRLRLGQTANMSSEASQRVLPRRLSFDGFIPNRKFQLILSAHPANPQFPLTGLAGILLALRLGSFGMRARRGGGDLLVLAAGTDAEDKNLQGVTNLLQQKAPNRQILVEQLAAEIRLAESAVKVGRHSAGHLPGYPILVAEHAKVLVGLHAASYEEALNQMWDIRIQQPFHDDPLFGDVRKRRASPVHMRVTRTGDGYYPIMTIFRSRPNPSQDWATMQDFVERCLNSGFEEIYGGGVSW